MARRLTQKDMKRDELVETAVDASQWLEQNWPLVAKAVGAAVVIVLLVVAFVWYGRHSREQAGLLLAQGAQRFQQAEAAGFADPSLIEEALGYFERAAGRSSASPAGQSARYYQGAALYRLGRLEEASSVLEELTGDELTPTLHGGTRFLLAETLAARGEGERATALLEEMAGDAQSAFPPDQVLLRLGHVHRALGNEAKARMVWERIGTEYPQSAGAAEARQLLVTP